MEKLAVELLTNIFTLACTDGGYTACSLSLVCKHFREVARPLRFHSVALSGAPDQLQQFFVQLEREHERAARESDAAAKVRHLYLRMQQVAIPQLVINAGWGFEPARTHAEGTDTDTAAPSAPVHEQPKDDPNSAAPQTRDEYAALVSALLRLVAPTLETLVFLPFAYAPPIEPGIVFPVLRELALATPPVSNRYSDTPEEMPPYPALRRLHLLSGGVNVEHWAFHAPEVTHIRVSAVGYRANTSDLALIHGDPSQESASQPFSRLQTVIFQLAPPPPRRYCHGMPSLWYKRMVPALWEKQAAARVPVYIIPPPEKEKNSKAARRPAEEYDDHREEWEGRIRGGAGCWEVVEEYARARFAAGGDPPRYLTPWVDPA